MESRAFSALAVFVLAASLAPGSQPATETTEPPGTTVRRPEAAGRVVKIFDFEERSDPARPDFNPEPVPRHWVRAQHAPPERDRLGFPLGNKAEYDQTVAHRGKVSIRLPTAGGSTALRLGATLLPVFPNTDYAVTAWVRTQDTRHTRAFLVAQFTDAKGDAIPGAIARSGPLTGEAWREVVVALPGRWPHAAFVQIELLLLQPEQFEGRAISGKHHVWEQDFQGAAWFDDLCVMQMPRVELRASSPVNIGIGRDATTAPTFSLRVQDLTGEAIEAALTLRDVDDRVVATATRALGAGGGRFDWMPTLPAYGWYEATVELLGGGGEGQPGVAVGKARCAVIWGPPGGGEAQTDGAVQATPSAKTTPGGTATDRDIARRVRSRFGLVVNDLHANQDALLDALVDAIGAGRVTIAIPEETERDHGNTSGAAGTAKANDSARLERLRHQVDPLLRERVQVEFRVTGVPDDLARVNDIDPGDPLALFELEPTKWMPAFRDVLDVFGQRVRRWSLGSGRDHATLMRPDLVERLTNVRTGLARSIPGPLLVLPWRADWAWPAAATGSQPAVNGLSVEVPHGLPLASLSDLATQWAAQRGEGVGLEAVIEPLPEGLYGRRAAAEELAKRAAVLWEALDPWKNGGKETALALRQPWEAGASGGAFEPDATLAAWRTLMSRIGPRRIAGRLPASPGVTCLVLVDAASSRDGPGRGALMLWSDGSDSDAHITAYIGDHPLREADLFGNDKPLPPGRPGMPRRLAATPTPVFIEGINEHLALFIEGLSLDPNFVDAVASEHEHSLVLKNPWPVRLTGEVQLAPPEGSRVASTWRFSPTAPMPFALGPGESARLPIAFSFSAAEEAGPASIAAIVRLSAGTTYPPMALGVPIRIGLKELELTPSLVLSPTSSGPDVVVTATITNTGTRPRTLHIEALASGIPSQQQPVSNLGPGETVVRRFVLRDAAQQLAGRRVRVTLSDAEGSERLNRSVVVP